MFTYVDILIKSHEDLIADGYEERDTFYIIKFPLLVYKQHVGKVYMHCYLNYEGNRYIFTKPSGRIVMVPVKAVKKILKSNEDSMYFI